MSKTSKTSDEPKASEASEGSNPPKTPKASKATKTSKASKAAKAKKAELEQGRQLSREAQKAIKYRHRMFKDCRDSWASNHFEKLPTGERRCLAEGCRTIYGKLSGHHALRHHWAKKHNQANQISEKFTFCDKNHDNYLVKWIIDSQGSYSDIARPSFKRYIEHLNPTMPPMCPKTLSKTIQDKLELLRRRIKYPLKDEPTMALTFDTWSPHDGALHYGCVTANFIDRTWTMRSLIIEFKQMPFPHDSNDIYEFIKSAIEEMDIKGKVIAITSNSDAHVLEAIKALERELNLEQNFGSNKFTHIRCLGQIIDEAVQLAVEPMKPNLIEARRLVSALRSSSARIERFLEIQKTLIDNDTIKILEPLELVDDAGGNWQATYLMIQRMLKLQVPINEAQVSIPDLRDLEPIDWQRIGSLEQFLMPLHCLIDRLAAEKYCTISSVSSAIPKVIEYLGVSFSDTAISKAAADLRWKLMDFMEHCIQQDTVFAANILDPRFKTKGLEASSVNAGVAMIRKMCDTGATEENSVPQRAKEEPSDIFFESDEAIEPVDEIALYLSAPKDHPKVNLLDSWNVKAQIHPKLAVLARKVLPIQATSIASERLQTIAGPHFADNMKRLDSDNFRSNIICKSWLTFIGGLY